MATLLTLVSLNTNSLSSFSQLPTLVNNTQQQQFPTVPPAKQFPVINDQRYGIEYKLLIMPVTYIPAQGINLNPASKNTTRYINPEQTSKLNRSSRGASNVTLMLNQTQATHRKHLSSNKLMFHSRKRIEDFHKVRVISMQQRDRGNRSLNNEEPKNDYLSYACG